MSAELMAQGARDQRRRRLSELNSALDLMANATVRMAEGVDVSSGVLRVIEHFLEELDADAALNVVQDLQGGRGDRWMAEAYALDACEGKRMFRAIKRAFFLPGKPLAPIYALYTPRGRIIQAQKTCLDREGDEVWVAQMRVDDDESAPPGSDDISDGVWCCWVPIGVI